MPAHGANVLVIGYGNELRGDDALGQRVAATVGAWNLPGVRVLSVHQLTPDLALAISEARRVIFVDAGAHSTQSTVQIRSVRGLADPPSLGHTSNPGELMALARALYDRSPPAWLVTAPAEDFALGDQLSARAQSGFEAAARAVRGLCTGATFA